MNVALTFSGGGFRAASFSLGVISYLAKLKSDGGFFLDYITVLSTVSGGTITGATYAIGIKKGKSIEEIYASLYHFMGKTDLVSLALDRLISNIGWDANRTKNLINAIADVYDAYLFENEKFGTLLSDNPPVHLKHISFNATEFANALQFRFQCSEEIINPQQGEPDRGIVGNYFFNIPYNIAQHIRMADILAASSCFPGGFEPINFPNDFILPPHPTIQELKMQDRFPVGLMDGGIVDNQGIEPVLLAEMRIRRNRTNITGTNSDDKALDLIIVCDVASPYMENYKASQQNEDGFWRKLTPRLIFTVNSAILLASIFFVCFSFHRNLKTLLLVSTFIFTVSIICFLAANLLKSVPRRMHVPSAFFKPIGKLLKLKLAVYENMFINRLNSMLKMTNDVFLKHVRRLNYKAIFTDPSWKNRRIMSAIHELKEGEQRIEDKIDSGVLPQALFPSLSLQKVATKASGMGTTLWFTKEELEKGRDNPYCLLDSIIASGQFTMCWNLLEYIEKVKKDNTNTGPGVAKVLACEQQLLEDWQKFNEDPYWFMAHYYNKN